MYTLAKPVYRLHSFLVRLSVVLFLLHLGATIGRAQDFCAVKLHVAGSGGERVTSTWIELEDPSGKVVRKEMMVGPDLKICDFGFGPHTLRVGTNECLPTTISNLRLVFGSPLTLNVVLNGCGYRGLRNACLAYLRVVGEDGAPMSGATFSPPLAAQPPRTDSYGRYQGLFRGSRDITFNAPGFEPASVHLECKQDEEVDQMVIMHRVP